jgi:hypothetical protein
MGYLPATELRACATPGTLVHRAWLVPLVNTKCFLGLRSARTVPPVLTRHFQALAHARTVLMASTLQWLVLFMILFARTVLQENTPHTLDLTNASAAQLENTLQSRVPPVQLFARPVLQASTLVLVAMWLALTVLPESTHWKEQRSAPTVPPDTPRQLELLSAPLFVVQAMRHPPHVLLAFQENTRLQDQVRPVHNARMGIAVEILQQLVSIAYRLQMHTFTNGHKVGATVTGETCVYATWVTSAMYSVQVPITSH